MANHMHWGGHASAVATQRSCWSIRDGPKKLAATDNWALSECKIGTGHDIMLHLDLRKTLALSGNSTLCNAGHLSPQATSNDLGHVRSPHSHPAAYSQTRYKQTIPSQELDFACCFSRYRSSSGGTGPFSDLVCLSTWAYCHLRASTVILPTKGPGLDSASSDTICKPAANSM